MYVDNFVFAHFQGRYNITATINYNQSTYSVHAYTYVIIINKTIKHIHVLTITLINNNYILRNDPSISYGNFLSINITYFSQIGPGYLSFYSSTFDKSLSEYSLHCLAF